MRPQLLFGLAMASLALSAGCYGSGGGGDEGSGAAAGNGGSSSAGRGGTSSTGGSVSSGGSTSSGGTEYGAGGSYGGGGSGGNGGSAVGGCTGEGSVYETFDKSCGSASDCVLVDHMTSCCGDSVRMAINASELERYAPIAASCDAQYPLCGCASQGVSAEDGTLVMYGSEASIVAECSAGQCQSRYDGVTFQCANSLCTDQQTCSIVIGGPAGSEPSGSCYFDNGCNDCSCAGGNLGCECSAVDGNVTITCAAP